MGIVLAASHASRAASGKPLPHDAALRAGLDRYAGAMLADALSRSIAGAAATVGAVRSRSLQEPVWMS